jgi:hypothetical protein
MIKTAKGTSIKGNSHQNLLIKAPHRESIAAPGWTRDSTISPSTASRFVERSIRRPLRDVYKQSRQNINPTRNTAEL